MIMTIPLTVAENGDLIPPEQVRSVLLHLQTRQLEAETFPDGRLVLSLSPAIVAKIQGFMAEENFADEDDPSRVEEEVSEIRRELFRERYGIVR
jgi:hypothetical protein